MGRGGEWGLGRIKGRGEKGGKKKKGGRKKQYKGGAFFTSLNLHHAHNLCRLIPTKGNLYTHRSSLSPPLLFPLAIPPFFFLSVPSSKFSPLHPTLNRSGPKFCSSLFPNPSYSTPHPVHPSFRPPPPCPLPPMPTLFRPTPPTPIGPGPSRIQAHL